MNDDHPLEGQTIVAVEIFEDEKTKNIDSVILETKSGRRFSIEAVEGWLTVGEETNR